MSNQIGLKESIYYKSPVFIQNILCSIKGVLIRRRRYSSDFMKYLDDYNTHKFNQLEELRSFCLSIKDVPYYKKLFAAVGFNPSAGDLYAEFKKLPILTKADVIANKSDIINPFYQGKVIHSSTGGTTGAGLEFPLSVEAENKQWAVCWRYREQLGIAWDTWHGWFGGKVIIPPTHSNAPFWRINRPCKQVMFSSLHLSDKNIAAFHQCIRDKKLTWLHGYSANINLLASLIVSIHLEPITSVKFITTGSDNLLDSYRATMKKAFPNATIATHYAQSECVANISEMPNGKMFVDEDFSYVELIPFDPSQPKLRKVIGTNFVNLAFPLLRYDTGDIVTVENAGTEQEYVSKIDGREAEYLKLPNGQKIGVTFIDNFEMLKNVNAVQFYQPNIHTLVIRVETSKVLGKDIESEILSELKARLACDIDIKFDYLTKIPRTQSGKLRLLISEV